MAKKNTNLTPEQSVEIVVGTYWPTRIIKTVTIKDLQKDSFRDEITLGGAEARYLYNQLKTLFGEADQVEGQNNG